MDEKKLYEEYITFTLLSLAIPYFPEFTKEKLETPSAVNYNNHRKGYNFIINHFEYYLGKFCRAASVTPYYLNKPTSAITLKYTYPQGTIEGKDSEKFIKRLQKYATLRNLSKDSTVYILPKQNQKTFAFQLNPDYLYRLCLLRILFLPEILVCKYFTEKELANFIISDDVKKKKDTIVAILSAVMKTITEEGDLSSRNAQRAFFLSELKKSGIEFNDDILMPTEVKEPEKSSPELAPNAMSVEVTLRGKTFKRVSRGCVFRIKKIKSLIPKYFQEFKSEDGETTLCYLLADEWIEVDLATLKKFWSGLFEKYPISKLKTMRAKLTDGRKIIIVPDYIAKENDKIETTTQ
jgi:hypothetical protein